MTIDFPGSNLFMRVGGYTSKMILISLKKKTCCTSKARTVRFHLQPNLLYHYNYTKIVTPIAGVHLSCKSKERAVQLAT